MLSFIKYFLHHFSGEYLEFYFLFHSGNILLDDMHGKYPFPEATATTEVLIAGEKGENKQLY